MDTPYLGEISMSAVDYAPVGWHLCNGDLLSIAENDALYALIGTTYGGDGQVTFAVPNLNGRVPIHMGRSNEGITYIQGQIGGHEEITLLTQNLPPHVHAVTGSISYQTRGDSAGNFANPEQHSIAQAPLKKFFGKTLTSATMAPLDSSNIIGTAGNSLPHNNMQPYCTINFIIALAGVFPSRG